MYLYSSTGQNLLWNRGRRKKRDGDRTRLNLWVQDNKAIFFAPRFSPGNYTFHVTLDASNISVSHLEANAGVSAQALCTLHVHASRYVLGIRSACVALPHERFQIRPHARRHFTLWTSSHIGERCLHVLIFIVSKLVRTHHFLLLEEKKRLSFENFYS